MSVFLGLKFIKDDAPLEYDLENKAHLVMLRDSFQRASNDALEELKNIITNMKMIG